MWQLLTITRPAEAAEARWDEIEWRTVGIPFFSKRVAQCAQVSTLSASWWTSQHNCLPGSINCALDKFLMEYLIRNLITSGTTKSSGKGAGGEARKIVPTSASLIQPSGAGRFFCVV